MNSKLNTLINIFIASVWFLSGLLYKILLISPRHQLIVGKILGSEYAEIFTFLIGISEVLLALWILWGRLPRWTAIFQMLIIAVMNLLEFFLASEFLLWGRWNILFAFFFILFIYRFQFYPNTKNHSVR